jgi:hypothetical protein
VASKSVGIVGARILPESFRRQVDYEVLKRAASAKLCFLQKNKSASAGRENTQILILLGLSEHEQMLMHN